MKIDDIPVGKYFKLRQERDNPEWLFLIYSKDNNILIWNSFQKQSFLCFFGNWALEFELCNPELYENT